MKMAGDDFSESVIEPLALLVEDQGVGIPGRGGREVERKGG